MHSCYQKRLIARCLYAEASPIAQPLLGVLQVPRNTLLYRPQDVSIDTRLRPPAAGHVEARSVSHGSNGQKSDYRRLWSRVCVRACVWDAAFKTPVNQCHVIPPRHCKTVRFSFGSGWLGPWKAHRFAMTCRGDVASVTWQL